MPMKRALATRAGTLNCSSGRRAKTRQSQSLRLHLDYPRQAAALENFAEAVRAFQAVVPAEERALFGQFESCESMLKSLEAQAAKSPEKSRLLRCCKKISHFAQRWQPFFEITSIFVSSNPEYAALAWGAIRLLFKVPTYINTLLIPKFVV